jgi:CheY-like chemotaxis protein
MSNPKSDIIKNLVSDRLKHVDLLVKQGKIDDAMSEIAQIRLVDDTNPYARAYEERIHSLKETLRQQRDHEARNPKPSEIVPTKIQTPLPEPPKEILPQPIPRPTPPVVKEPLQFLPSVPPPLADAPRAITPSASDLSPKVYPLIMLVDDDPRILNEMKSLLEDNDFLVTSFLRADDALEYLRDRTPDLVLCDVNLETSSFGGFTLYEKMREFDHLQNVPFIFLSGLRDSAIILTGKQIGADDYLTKPIDPESLLAVVKGKLKRFKQKRKN